MDVTLQVKRRTTAGTDAHGNPVVTFADPVDWHVYGIKPTAATETMADNRDRSVVVWTVYAPADAQVPTEYDRVVVDGREYEVDGHPGDWTNGPWLNPLAGAVIELKRAEG